MMRIHTVDGRRYGTAQAIVAHLACPDVTVSLIYSWARRGLIQRFHRPGRGRGTTWYLLDEVTAVEKATAESGLGRKRAAAPPPAASYALAA